MKFHDLGVAPIRGVCGTRGRHEYSDPCRETLDIGNRTVLARLAEETGLDPAAYTAALDDQMYAERHREALAESARMNITVVPTIIIGARRIEGVATEGVIRCALDTATAA